MIWTRGRLIPDQAFTLSPHDRALEHGIGLFESLRTWGGRTCLLDRHLERLCRSASELGLEIDPRDLPGMNDVAALVQAWRGMSESAEDVRLRITATGGLGPPRSAASLVFMTAGPLPPPIEPAAQVRSTLTVPADDLLARHKTLNYWRMRLAHDQAQTRGEHEVLCVGPDGRVWQGTRTNLFLVRRNQLQTPSLLGPVLPGVMRALVLEQARQLGLPCAETPTFIADLDTAQEIFLSNAVRGIVPVGQILDRSLPAPGPMTQKLASRVSDWLAEHGADAP